MADGDYLGQAAMQAAVLPARVAYLIKQGSTTGFRRAIGEACMRWGGMTEPIARVSETGELEFWDAHAVRTAQVEAAVNVDLAPETAAVAAGSLGLPCVRIADIDRFGPGIATCYPAAVTGLGGRAPSPLIAAVDSPLWQAVAAGGVQEGTSDASALHPTARVSTLDDEIGSAQLTGDTHINDTVAQFGEHRAITAGHVSVVVWVTPRDGLEDCVGFWNTRAIRPVTTVDMPMLLLPAEGVAAWQGFVPQLEALLARPAEFTPDVLLVSRALPQADLEKFAASLGLERSAEGPRAGTRFPSPPRRQPPFTFLTGANPMGMVSFERDYGLTASFDAQVFAGTTTARFSSPVHFHASGGTLVRISGAPLDRLPKRDCLAKEVHPNAEWRGAALQLSTTARRDYLFELTIPTLEKATRRLIQEATAAHAPSGPGRLAAALIRKSDIAALLKPGVYEAAVALTTPRSKELLNRLEEAAGEGEDREELVQIAATWGGRSERRSLAPDQLPGPRAQAAAAAERLSAMGWAERGLRSVCGECGVSTFVPLAEIAGAARCPGCSAMSSFEVRAGQTSLFYRLDSLVDRACDHGALAHLLVIAKLLESRPESCFLPGTDVNFQDGTSSEVDIFGIYGGQVLAGEVKSSGTDFTQDQLDRDIPLSARLGADVHLMAAIDTVPADARESATRMCEEAGLELLILEGADLCPPAEQVPQATPLQVIAALQEAAATLRELSGKPHPPKRGQLAKVVKQTLTGTESVSPTHITVLETLVGHFGEKLTTLLEGAGEQLRAVADSLSSPEPTADDGTADPPEPPGSPDDLRRSHPGCPRDSTLTASRGSQRLVAEDGRAASQGTGRTPVISSNSDLTTLLDTLIASHTIDWVTGHQPVDWRPRTWKASWKAHGLPCSNVLDELEAEITAHGTIRRSFIFSTYQDRRATELFIAAMAWGSGTGGRGLARIRAILAQPDAADKIQATVDTVRQHGAAAGYKSYFSQNRLSQLDVAFATKLLYFAGYQHQHPGQPRPLIYDSRVATAVTRLPTAPLLPTVPDGVTTSKYEAYCAWAEAIAQERHTEPAAVEWALFALGGGIRDELRR